MFYGWLTGWHKNLQVTAPLFASYKNSNISLLLCLFSRMGSPKDKNWSFILKNNKPGHAWQPLKNNGAPSKMYVHENNFDKIWKGQGSCEVGHVTGLARCDKDTVSMVQCTDAVWTHKCAPVPPPWGPRGQWEGGMGAHAPRGHENDPPQSLPSVIFPDFCQLRLTFLVFVCLLLGIFSSSFPFD
jgi:hypothetical protein